MRLELPGLCDLQVNGFGGVDYNSPKLTAEDLLRSLEVMRGTGVTRCLPTLITSSLESFTACARTIAGVSHPAIAGIHMEGPYISPEDGPRGAHPRRHTFPALMDDFARRQEAAGGKIRLVTLAPEVPGGLAMIEHLVGTGVKVAIGHTGADAQTIRDAIHAGATLSTHLGNGSSRVLPRHPNLIWDQLAADELMASFILDGHHLPPATAKAMIRAKTLERSILVTDAVSAAGCEPGEYELSGMLVVLRENGTVGPPGTTNLAGSALTMDTAVANTVKYTGIKLEEAWRLGAEQPSRYLGLAPQGRCVVDWEPAECRLKIVRVIDS
jgi:N-acetylglucosamine-6-phosphate deacetylase